jgi:hypothetical protein
MLNRVQEDNDNYHVIFEDEEGRRISKDKLMYHKGPLFKCWVAEGTRFQIEKIR